MSVSRVRAEAISLTLVVCALWAASACKDKPDAPPAEQEQRRAEEAKEVEAELARQHEKHPVVVPVPEAMPAEGAPPSAAQLPVPEDFQAETAATIMRANYLSELDKLEGELQADEN